LFSSNILINRSDPIAGNAPLLSISQSSEKQLWGFIPLPPTNEGQQRIA